MARLDPMSDQMAAVETSAAPAAPAGPTRAHWWILVVIAGAQLMVVLDSTIMIIALPSAQHGLGFSNTDRQWVVTAYTLAFGGFLVLGGRISDMIGTKTDPHHRRRRFRPGVSPRGRGPVGRRC